MGLRRLELRLGSAVARVPYILGPRANQHQIAQIRAGAAPSDDDTVTVIADIASLPATVTISGTNSAYDGTWATTSLSSRTFGIHAGGLGGNLVYGGRWD